MATFLHRVLLYRLQGHWSQREKKRWWDENLYSFYLKETSVAPDELMERDQLRHSLKTSLGGALTPSLNTEWWPCWQDEAPHAEFWSLTLQSDSKHHRMWDWTQTALFFGVAFLFKYGLWFHLFTTTNSIKPRTQSHMTLNTHTWKRVPVNHVTSWRSSTRRRSWMTSLVPHMRLWCCFRGVYRHVIHLIYNHVLFFNRQ